MAPSEQFRRRRAPPPTRHHSNPFDDDTVDSPERPKMNNRTNSTPFDSDDDSHDDDHHHHPSGKSGRPHDPLLDLYENRLHEDVDPDFFSKPEEFQALNRVITILGAEIGEGGSLEIATNHDSNPAYISLKNQQRVVEEAIEHMAVKHCADLNSSVAAVGRMSRQFEEAERRVKNLRRQVRDVKDSLRLGGSHAGMGESANPNEPEANSALNAANAAAAAGASARSLRELWLKKLECEAVLSLLRKLEIIRRAPGGFDALIRPIDGGPCRIGAAVVVLSEALSIMFSDDVAQVQAFDKIMEQLMTRKQRAEEILWATLTDVLYRHGEQHDRGEEEKRRRARMERRARAIEAAKAAGNNGMATIAEVDSDEEDSHSYSHTANSYEDDVSTKGGESSSAGGSGSAKEISSSGPSSGVGVQFKRMVGRAILESEIDLEGDELRCLEEPAAWGSHSNYTFLPASYLYPEQALPRYTDPVLALRILVECLTKLKRLDDVEQYLRESIEREIRQVAQREQAKTLTRLEKRRGRPVQNEGDGDGNDKGEDDDDSGNLKEFRIHLNNLLKAFGGIMTRFMHLAQILRHKICSDSILARMCPSYPVPSSALYSVIVAAETAMQNEIKSFLSACIAESDKPKDKRKNRYNAMHMDQSQLDVERGVFSLGISSLGRDGVVGRFSAAAGFSSRANIVELPSNQFVNDVLFPRTNTDPEVRHALTFRRSLSRWTHEITESKRELAICSGEDTSAPMYQNSMEEGALHYIDTIIQRTLLPEMQDEAVNAVIHFLERRDAFDPILSDAFSRYPSNSVQLEAEMSVACQALYTSTRPIFMALHRLPKGGDMYLSLVTMLEHAMLTFISRMKQRVSELISGKTAYTLLEDERGNPSPFSQAMDRRKAFSLLLRIYNDEDDVDDPSASVEPSMRVGGILPLPPPDNDTSPKKGGRSSFGIGTTNEKVSFEKEVEKIEALTQFTGPLKFDNSNLCNDDELMKAACLANSLLRVSSLLEGQLRNRAGTWEKSVSAVRDLQSAIKTIRFHGLRVAKFCRAEILVQTAKKMSEICMSSVLVAEDAVRLPSCVNNLGEYLTTSSDNIREAGGNAIAAHSFSSLEQYIPLFLIQTARIIAEGTKPTTMNGIESLDRTGSVLYRDLKGATSFENSFWDEDAAAHSFEQSAVFVNLMEISSKDLEDHYRNNPTQFSDGDYELMFKFNGPRRRGDFRRFNLLKSKMKTEKRMG
mmetsp:Transcript_11811/g.24910  ORF Transcript_11811/g.24910 Transcript_11811/m.24910 type:complete len:1226 (+) Transcript_11811:62-3739(+)